MTYVSPAQAPKDAWRLALRLAAASEQYIAQLRASMGLSSNEMNVLLLLHDGGACTMTELSHRVRLTRPALTTLVDRLEARNWVHRLPDPGDRRRVIVSLTDRFEVDFVDASYPWRERLQDLASLDPTAWERLGRDVEALCKISAHSAMELRTAVRPAQ